MTDCLNELILQNHLSIKDTTSHISFIGIAVQRIDFDGGNFSVVEGGESGERERVEKIAP
jgi:hypothetical protein